MKSKKKYLLLFFLFLITIGYTQIIETVNFDPDPPIIDNPIQGPIRDPFQPPIIKPDQPKPDQPKPDQPKPDQPKPDQPKPDQPKPDQPKPDQPKPERPGKRPSVEVKDDYFNNIDRSNDFEHNPNIDWNPKTNRKTNGNNSMIKIDLPDGSRYKGPTKNYLAHGKGKMIFPNGDVYNGNFKNGFMEGFDGEYKGYLESSNTKDWYTLKVNWIKNNPHGKGKLTVNSIIKFNSKLPNNKDYYGNTIKSNETIIISKVIEGNLWNSKYPWKTNGFPTKLIIDNLQYDGVELVDGVLNGSANIKLSNSKKYLFNVLYENGNLEAYLLSEKSLILMEDIESELELLKIGKGLLFASKYLDKFAIGSNKYIKIAYKYYLDQLDFDTASETLSLIKYNQIIEKIDLTFFSVLEHGKTYPNKFEEQVWEKFKKSIKPQKKKRKTPKRVKGFKF